MDYNKRRLNTQIFNKTQLALQAIKRYDMDQSKVNVHFQPGLNSGKLLNDLDNDYSKLTSHKVLKLDHTYKLSLFTYSEEFYDLQMKNYIFPMRVLIKNVKNQGTIYVGYDQKYPGIYQTNKMEAFEKPGIQQKNYDYKAAVNRDLIIILKNKGNKMINNVYFTIIAGKSFFMCDLKVEFLGFTKDERVKSEVKINQIKLTPKKSSRYDGSQLFPARTKTQGSYNIINSPEFVRNKITLDKLDHPYKVQQFSLIMNKVEPRKLSGKSNIFRQQSKISRSQKSRNQFNPTETIRNRTISTRYPGGHKREKSDLDLKIEEVKRNKEMIEEYKVKDKQLRQTASKCKRMIQSYKKTFNEQNVRKRRMNRDLVLMIFSARFIKNVYDITNKRISKETNKIRVNYLVLKFVKTLKKQYEKSCQMVPFRSKRITNEASSGIYFFAKMLNKHSLSKAESTIKQTLDFLHPLFLVRHSIKTSSTYRNSIRLIQKVWKTKYHGRIYSLLYFVDNHVQKMIKEFPHFKMFQEQFYQAQINRKICLDYIKDESQKYRFIYEAYRKKLQQIQEIVKINSMVYLNKNAHIKHELQVPRRPTKPMHRFFRNSDILKSMVRTWFQIEYKKYIKKSLKYQHY